MTAPAIYLSKKEQRQYILGEALFYEDRNSLAWEVSEELRNQMPQSAAYHGGLLVPYTLPVTERAGLDTGTSTKGQELKFTGGYTFIDALRRRSVVLKGGATVMDGLTN